MCLISHMHNYIDIYKSHVYIIYYREVFMLVWLLIIKAMISILYIVSWFNIGFVKWWVECFTYSSENFVSLPSTYFGSLLFIFWIIGWKESFILPISSPSLDPVSFHFLENFIGPLPPFPIFLFFFSTNAGLANSKHSEVIVTFSLCLYTQFSLWTFLFHLLISELSLCLKPDAISI